MNPQRGALLKPSEQSRITKPSSGNGSLAPRNNKLSDVEKKKLRKLEAVIETPGLAVSYALRTIREERLYRQGFDTFEAYCHQRWGFTRQRAYQLLAALDVVENLPAQMSTIVDTESQARELAKVPKEARVKVLTEASSNGKVTAKKITAAAQAVTDAPITATPKPKAETAKILDKFNRVVPEEMAAEWQRAAQTGKKLQSLAREIKSILSEGFSGAKQERLKDVIYAEITNSAISDAEALSWLLSSVIPYAICPTCQGFNRKSCALCKRRGWISKFLWNSPAVSRETKAIIEGT